MFVNERKRRPGEAERTFETAWLDTHKSWCSVYAFCHFLFASSFF